MDDNNNIKKAPNVPPFLRYCSAIIPTAFDDSLSYYEALCALYKFLQDQVVTTINNNAQVTEEYIQMTKDMKSYMDHYFDNLDVQEEINIKLDAMAESGELTEIIGDYVDKEVDPIINEQNENIARIDGRVDTISSKINDIVSLNPIPVASTSDMTDHTKVYLLTTSGHWYYYDSGSEGFVDGGAYQSTIPTDLTDSNILYKGITPASLKNYSTQNLSTDFTNERYGKRTGISITPAGAVDTTLGSNYVTYEYLVPKNSFITINKPVATSRFRVALTPTRIANGDTVDLINDNTSVTNVSTFTGENCWVYAFISNTGEDTDVNVFFHTREQIADLIGVENMLPFVPVPAGTELFNPALKLEGVSIGRSTNYHALQNSAAVANARSYMFALVANTTYTIKKDGGDRFRVALYRNYPTFQDLDNDTGANYFNCRPSVIVVDDNDETECTFDSEEYKYCVITTSNSADEYSLSIKASSDTYELSKQWYEVNIDDQSKFVFNPAINTLDSFWTMWSGRLAWGINTSIAPVPVQMNSQLFVNGMIIAHLNPDNTRGYNRHGKHVFEAYDSNNYARMTMLLHKHQSEIDSKPSFEQYYYTGNNHNASSYGLIKIGSDVDKHSFLFQRDKLSAYGTIDCQFPLQLARINPATDLDNTYQTVAQADSAHEPETQSSANTKCLKWIALHNAPDGTMFYDEQREKVVVKVNGNWCDLQTTPVAGDTYDF